MIKAVLDTNIFISGLFWKGAPYEILDLWRHGAFQWVLSPEIYEEYRRVSVDMSRHFPSVDLGDIFRTMELYCEMTEPVERFHLCTDRDDDKFIDTAVAANAGYIITGDKALLKVGRVESVVIIPPANFLKRLRASGDEV